MKFWIWLGLLSVIGLSGCARYRPIELEQTGLLKRQQIETKGGVTVKVAAMSHDESRHVFGTSLASKGIQPVWIDITNQDREPYLFFPRSVSDYYFSPDEVLQLAKRRPFWRRFDSGISSILFLPTIILMPIDYFRFKSVNQKIEDRLSKLAFCKFVIRPGKTERGFVFVPIQEGTREIPIHLNAFGKEADKDFLLTTETPGIHQDYSQKKLEKRFSKSEFVDLNQEKLREFIESLPCCAKNKKANREGDPINLILIGNLETILEVFVRAKWTETEVLNFKTAFKTLSAFFNDEPYFYSPVSPLYFNGRPQDIALQKVRENIHQRMHLRLWLTQYRFNGANIWVGQVSRDIGIKFTMKTWNFTTHKIDPQVDDAREYVFSDLMAINKIKSVGYVRGGKPSFGAKTRVNLTGDYYFTDGLRLVSELSGSVVRHPNFLWREFPSSLDQN